jgi:hypothetical protein
LENPTSPERVKQTETGGADGGFREGNSLVPEKPGIGEDARWEGFFPGFRVAFRKGGT